MAHELEINADGSANMIWADTPCWHGLGTEMDPKKGAVEWMKAANLDWDVVKQPMFASLPNGENINVLGKNGGEYSVLVRDKGKNTFDQDDVFGPVGPEWVPVQNSEVFQFMERFCKAGKMQMETCGALKGGTEIWALAKFRDDFDIIPGDPMKGYLLFHSAHVWGKGNQVRLTPIRVVCNNTLTMAIGSSGRKAGGFRMPHTKAFDSEVQASAEMALGLADEQIKQLQEAAAILSKTKATPEKVHEFIAKLYQPKLIPDMLAANDTNPIHTSFSPSSENVWEAINRAPGHDLYGSKGTWWGAFNGVTYHEDHMRISYTDQSNVLGSTWFGAGARRKDAALDLAMEYAEVA